MHYHYNPDMPDSSLNPFCENHIPEDERWLTYLCDCERNQCVVCEEDDSGELAQETATSAKGNGNEGDRG